ncbi:MAG: helix-turn-helix domain-containing protein [Actinomycetota bacterium]
MTEPSTLGAQMRALRRAHGLSMRRMTVLIGLSAHSNLADYESGRRIPPQDVVEAFERALGVVDGELSALRRAALADRARVPAPRPDAEIQLTGPADGRSVLATVRQRWWRPVAAVALVVAVLAWWHVRADAAQPVERVAMGVSSCDASAVILDTATLLTAGPRSGLVGTVALRYSPSCGLGWARFIPSAAVAPGGGRVVLSAHRVADDASTTLPMAQIVSAESDPLLTVPGCVYAEASVVFADGVTVTARTACRQG